MKVRCCKIEDINSIIKIQEELFPTSYYVKLHNLMGRKGGLLDEFNNFFINKYPQLFLVSENDYGDICGFIIGYYGDKNELMKPFKNKMIKKLMITPRLWFFLLSYICNKIRILVTGNDEELVIVDNNIKESVMDKRGHIFFIGVRPQEQGSGISRLLLNSFVNQIKNDGYNYCMLVCSRYRERAMNFYKKTGFKEYAHLGNTEIVYLKEV